MSQGYDAIVIGAGPAGQHCAGHLAGGGLRVAIVERKLGASLGFLVGYRSRNERRPPPTEPA